MPSSVQRQRRRIREKVVDLREPIRQRRENLVPGPNIIGTVEDKLTDVRDSFVTRDSVVSRIKDRMGDEETSGDNGSGGSSTSSSEETDESPNSRGSSGDKLNRV